MFSEFKGLQILTAILGAGLLSLKVDEGFVFVLEDLGPILAVSGRYGYHGLNVLAKPVNIIFAKIKMHGQLPR